MINSEFDFQPVIAAVAALNQRGSQQAVIEQLMTLSRTLPEYPASHKTPENEIEGCETSTWLLKTEHGYLADSQSRLMRGLLLIIIYQHLHPEAEGLNPKQISASKRLAWARIAEALQAISGNDE